MITDLIKKQGTNLRQMSDETGIPYHNLYASLGNKHRSRDLRDWELMRVCEYMEIDPNCFLQMTAKNRLEVRSNRPLPEFVYPKHSADA